MHGSCEYDCIICSLTCVSASSGAAEAVATSVLQQLLNPQDAVLGPWVPRRDPLEDALNSFVGSAGGPSPHPWEAGMGFSAGYSGTAGESHKACRCPILTVYL